VWFNSRGQRGDSPHLSLNQTQSSSEQHADAPSVEGWILPSLYFITVMTKVFTHMIADDITVYDHTYRLSQSEAQEASKNKCKLQHGFSDHTCWNIVHNKNSLK